MPKTIAQYRVFIGSPAGLDDERKKFRLALDRFSHNHGEPSGASFWPVGWEDTLGGVGRPQSMINEDIRPCDFAVFVFSDRWGSPTGNGFTSGTEEEWNLARDLYEKKQLRSIVLFFKSVDGSRLRDPGSDLKKVLAFKKEIEKCKKYLYHSYSTVDEFSSILEGHLAKWLRDHAGSDAKSAQGDRGDLAVLPSDKDEISPDEPKFSYWLKEANRQILADDQDPSSIRFCAKKALALSSSNIEWSRAMSALAAAHYKSDPAKAYQIVQDVIVHLETLSLKDREVVLLATMMFNRASLLSRLNREDEALVAYNEVISKFGTNTDTDVEEVVTKAFINKGTRVGRASPKDSIKVFDEVIARLKGRSEPFFKEAAARALFNKATNIGRTGNLSEAIAMYRNLVAAHSGSDDSQIRDTIARSLLGIATSYADLNSEEDELSTYDQIDLLFGTDRDVSLRKVVLTAIFNKALVYNERGDWQSAIAIFDDIIRRFENEPDSSLREVFADSLTAKAAALDKLGRHGDELETYERIIVAFTGKVDAELRGCVSQAMYNKTITLFQIGRNQEALDACDVLSSSFIGAVEPSIRKAVAHALITKGAMLAQKKKFTAALGVFDEVLARFGSDLDLAMRGDVVDALISKANILALQKKPNLAIGILEEVVRRYSRGAVGSLKDSVKFAKDMLKELK